MAFKDRYWSKKDKRWYYRGRYLKADGQNYGTISRAEDGTRFRSEKAALQAAEEKETRIRLGLDEESAPSVAAAAKAVRRGTTGITLGEWANQWLPQQDIGINTLRGYRWRLEHHILPHVPEGSERLWEDTPLKEIDRAQIIAWRQKLKADGVAASSVINHNSLLSTLLTDAVEAGHISHNPAAKQRGRGRRSGRPQGTAHRTPEKVHVGPLQALLHAERCALITGRDDEFISATLAAYTGMRAGEIFGLQRPYVRPGAVRVEQQLATISGEYYLCEPKDDSYRTIDIPPFLEALLRHQLDRRRQPVSEVCPCYREPRVNRRLRRRLRETGLWNEEMHEALLAHEGPLSEVAGVPAELAAEFEDDYVRRAQVQPHRGGEFIFTGLNGPHMPRTTYQDSVFAPAASGWWPARTNPAIPARPVAVRADPWPGSPLRHANAAGKADACWTPIATGFTPHGYRHSHKNRMIERRIPEVLQHERLGHEMPGIAGVYSHVTDEMRAHLVQVLEELYTAALHQRYAMHPHSPVAVLDAELARLRGDSSPVFLPKTG